MKNKENYDAFLLQNAPFLTVTDLADELSISEYYIRTRCSQLGIQPIKKGEQTKQFILTHFQTKTPSQIAKLLGCGEENLRIIYKELNLAFGKRAAVTSQADMSRTSELMKNKSEELEEAKNGKKLKAIGEKGPSVREILGAYQAPGASHYHSQYG